MTRIPPSSSELKSIGLKATLPRLKVLEIFQRSSEELGVRHMSAEDVYKALIAEHIDVGLATVYRVLTQFEQAGLLARNHFEGGRAMFELNEVIWKSVRGENSEMPLPISRFHFRY